MAINIKPLADRVVAEPIEAEAKTASGLYLPGGAQEKPKVAKVVAVGPNVKDIKVGDNILYEDYSNTDVKVDGKSYIIVKEEKVLAVVN